MKRSIKATRRRKNYYEKKEAIRMAKGLNRDMDPQKILSVLSSKPNTPRSEDSLLREEMDQFYKSRQEREWVDDCNVVDDY